MPNSSARRYAQAVFEIALESQELDKWQSDLDQISMLGGNAEVTALLQNPKLRLDDKAKLLTALLGDVSPTALNLVKLLVSKGKWDVAAGIYQGYRDMLDAHRGIERANVTTAVPLDDEDKQKVEARLGAISGKKVLVTQNLDANMMGGVVARMGGKLLDGSVRTRLASLKQRISNNQI